MRFCARFRVRFRTRFRARFRTRYRARFSVRFRTLFRTHLNLCVDRIKDFEKAMTCSKSLCRKNQGFLVKSQYNDDDDDDGRFSRNLAKLFKKTQ